LQIDGVAGMCGDNVADVRFWVTVACMEGKSVTDGVLRHSLLI